MKLNNHSYLHKKIRLLCLQLEKLTGLRLVTNLSDNFQEISFMNELSYITIDYKHEKSHILSHRLTDNEWATITDIILYCSWLYIGQKYESKRKETANITKILQNKKKLDKNKKIV